MVEQHGKTLVPQIRFAGFTDPWEQRKLGEVAPLQRGFDLPVSQMISGPYPVVMSNGVGGWHSKYAVKGPGVVTGRSGTIGGLQYIEGDFWPHNTSLWVTSFNGNEPKFIYWLYSSLNLERFGSGSGVPTLNRNDVHDQLIGVPCNIAEQRRIGAFFDRLDSLITLHQRKYDKLCVLKKSMLDKMFPKGGSLYPEIRFAGFTDPWEQRKLGDITEILSGARVHKGEWRTEGVPFYRSSDVMAAFNNTDNERVFISQELFKELSARSGVPEQGDVMVTGGGSVGTPYIVPDNKPLYTKDADLIWIKHCDDISPEFLYYFFVAPVFRSYIASISHIGTIAHYTIEQVKDTSVGLPTQMAEQKMVGVFFKQLGSLITLHQRKLELLRNIKKSMLDKMFV